MWWFLEHHPGTTTLSTAGGSNYFSSKLPPGWITCTSAPVSAFTCLAHEPASWSISPKVPKWIGSTCRGRSNLTARSASSGPMV